MPAVIEQVPTQHTLINNSRQYDFIPQPGGEVVAIVCYAPRMTFRREVSAEEARQQWVRLKAQGYVEW